MPGADGTDTGRDTWHGRDDLWPEPGERVFGDVRCWVLDPLEIHLSTAPAWLRMLRWSYEALMVVLARRRLVALLTVLAEDDAATGERCVTETDG